jgi:thymidylate synthase
MKLPKDIIKTILSHPENQYLNLIERVINNGIKTNSRNGVTRSLVGEKMNFDLTNNTLPLITTKKLAWKTCLKELFWFISGDTDNANLRKQNVNIWNANASREFLDSRKLWYLDEDDLGPVYGHQWRHYNASYYNTKTKYDGRGVDQLENVVKMLKNEKERESRRIILNAWNPCQIDEMALPPCHVLSQFIVKNNELTTILYQRSGDIGLGIPFNIASYSFLTHILAKHCDIEAKEFIHIIGDAHIYEDHVEPLKEQIKRKPYEFPEIEILKKCESIDDYNMDHIKVKNYNYKNKINMEMKS